MRTRMNSFILLGLCLLLSNAAAIQQHVAPQAPRFPRFAQLRTRTGVQAISTCSCSCNCVSTSSQKSDNPRCAVKGLVDLPEDKAEFQGFHHEVEKRDDVIALCEATCKPKCTQNTGCKVERARPMCSTTKREVAAQHSKAAAVAQVAARQNLRRIEARHHIASELENDVLPDTSFAGSHPVIVTEADMKSLIEHLNDNTFFSRLQVVEAGSSSSVADRYKEGGEAECVNMPSLIDIIKSPKCSFVRTKCGLTESILRKAVYGAMIPALGATTAPHAKRAAAPGSKPDTHVAPVPNAGHSLDFLHKFPRFCELSDGKPKLTARGQKILPSVGAVAQFHFYDPQTDDEDMRKQHHGIVQGDHIGLLVRTGEDKYRFYMSWVSEYPPKESPEIDGATLCKVVEGHHQFSAEWNHVFALGENKKLYQKIVTSSRDHLSQALIAPLLDRADVGEHGPMTPTQRHDYMKCFELPGKADTEVDVDALTTAIHDCTKRVLQSVTAPSGH